MNELAGKKMNEKLQIEIPSEIPTQLQSRAIELSHLHVAEVAWLRKDAMEIIRQLKGSKVAILGGDVLQKRSGRFEYEYSNWAVDRQSNESPEAYAARSLEETEHYVRNFPDPDDGSVAYVLVFEKGNCQPGTRPDR